MACYESSRPPLLVPALLAVLMASTPVSASTAKSMPAGSGSQSLSDACKPASVQSDYAASKERCINYLSGYVAGIVEARQQSGSVAAVDYTRFEQRALKTRAGSYLQRKDESLNKESCLVDSKQQIVQLDSVLGDLGYVADKRAALLSSVEEMLMKSSTC